jgi:hypothetical protein
LFQYSCFCCVTLCEKSEASILKRFCDIWKNSRRESLREFRNSQSLNGRYNRTTSYSFKRTTGEAKGCALTYATCGNTGCSSTHMNRQHRSYKDIYTQQNLDRSWKLVKANKGSHGIDRKTIEDTEKDWPTICSTIQKRLSNHTYAPQPVRRVYIPQAKWKETTHWYSDGAGQSCPTSYQVCHRTLY